MHFMNFAQCDRIIIFCLRYINLLSEGLTIIEFIIAVFFNTMNNIESAHY